MESKTFWPFKGDLYIPLIRTVDRSIAHGTSRLDRRRGALAKSSFAYFFLDNSAPQDTRKKPRALVCACGGEMGDGCC